MRAAPAALVRAAQRAREIAARTGTPLIVTQNGKLVEKTVTSEMIESAPSADPSARCFAVPPARTFIAKGFTLVELAIVMFVVALLLGGMLLPLASQQDIRNYGDTQKILAEARDSLLGFAMANDRLPCPATNPNGTESPTGGGACTNPHDGFLPAATLGLSPVDAQGYRLDGWGGDTANRLRYAVSTANTNAFTSQNGMRTVGMTTLAPDLQICNTGTGITNSGNPATASCAANTALATDAVAVIFSLGKNAVTGGTTADELPNVTADRAFVNAPQGPAFDDQLLWLSKSALFNRMVAAGKLP